MGTGTLTYSEVSNFSSKAASQSPFHHTLSPPVMPTADYELLDFGDGRKLERFGPHVVARPCPTAEGVSPAHPELWDHVSG